MSFAHNDGDGDDKRDNLVTQTSHSKGAYSEKYKLEKDECY